MTEPSHVASRGSAPCTRPSRATATRRLETRRPLRNPPAGHLLRRLRVPPRNRRCRVARGRRVRAAPLCARGGTDGTPFAQQSSRARARSISSPLNGVRSARRRPRFLLSARCGAVDVVWLSTALAPLRASVGAGDTDASSTLYYIKLKTISGGSHKLVARAPSQLMARLRLGRRGPHDPKAVPALQGVPPAVADVLPAPECQVRAAAAHQYQEQRTGGELSANG
jgi:hypothetical protein